MLERNDFLGVPRDFRSGDPTVDPYDDDRREILVWDCCDDTGFETTRPWPTPSVLGYPLKESRDIATWGDGPRLY